LGDYDFQIRLLNNDLSSRATLPPVSVGIRVIEPLCEESVNSAPVNYSRAVIDREVEGTFDEEGNYNKTDWGNGDIITDKKLNKIEDAIYTVNDSKATKDDIPTDVSAFTNDAGYLTEHQSLEAYALKADIPSTDGLATEQYVDDAISNMPEEIPTVSGSKTVMYQLHTAFDAEGFYYLSGFSVNCVDPFDGTPMGSISLEDGLYYGKAYTGYDSTTGSKEVVKVSLYSYTTHTSYEFEEYMDPQTNSPSGKITHFVTPSVFVNQSDLTGYATQAYVDDAVANVDVDLTGYATEAYVQDAIDAIELPEPDLSNYATKDEIIGTIADLNIADINLATTFSLSSNLPEGLHLFKNVTINYKDSSGTKGALTISEDIVRVSHYDDTEENRGTITELYCYSTSTTYKFYVATVGITHTVTLFEDSSTTLPEYATKDDLSNYVTKDKTIGTISGSITPSSRDTSLASKLPKGLHLFKGVSISYKETETAFFTTSLALDDDIVRVSHYEDTNLPPNQDGTYKIVTELYCYGSSTTYKFYVKKGNITSLIILLSQESNTTDLSGYATKDELQTALGDIESLLGGI
jgi:hypothetical protein